MKKEKEIIYTKELEEALTLACKHYVEKQNKELEQIEFSEDHKEKMKKFFGDLRNKNLK